MRVIWLYILTTFLFCFWFTPKLYSQCPPASTVISEFPFQDENQTTCIYPLRYNNICGTELENLRDFIYEFAAEEGDLLSIDYFNFNPALATIIVTEACPEIEEICVAKSQGNAGEQQLNAIIPKTGTYFIIVSGLCNVFNIEINLSSNFQVNQSDCLGAFEICSPLHIVAEMPQDDGQIPNEIANLAQGGLNSCMLSNEGNSIWFSLYVYQDGFFRFVLNPENPQNDFDFVVYNATEMGCNTPAFEFEPISCNSFGLMGENGATGISTALGGQGNSNGPGANNGPAFNADLPVFSGMRLLIMINKFSEGTEGFTLDFSSADNQIFYPENTWQPKVFVFPKSVVLPNLTELEFNNFNEFIESLSPQEIMAISSDSIPCDATEFSIWFNRPLKCYYPGQNPFMSQFPDNNSFAFLSEQLYGNIETNLAKPVGCSPINPVYFGVSFRVNQPLDQQVFFNPNAQPFALQLTAGQDSIISVCNNFLPELEPWALLPIRAEPCLFEGFDVELVAPNIFTPNNDGVNDTFVVQNLFLYPNPIEFTLFNRWGRWVHNNSNYQNDFDGENLAEGTYYYLLSDAVTGELLLKGAVTIVR